ncbi:MAG: sugar phosphate isomerase/epimerase [Planctomycetes bacterium]|nr:sugar phosphate isomerase/epimerase [Planctomycetota bacterium]
MSEASFADRLAVCSWSLQPSNPRELIDRLAELGMDKVQLALDPLRTDEAWADAGSQLADAGIEVVAGMFGTVGEDYSTLESIRLTGGVVPDETWQENWRNIQKLVPIAESLGVKLVSFHAGFLPEDPADPSYEKLLGRLSQIADVFASAGIELGLETGQEDAATLRTFLERLAKPNVGVNFDPANMILYGKGDPVEAVRALVGSVRQVHIKDALPSETPGQWGTEVPVGTGAVDWPAFLGTLAAGGFDGYLAIEREAGDQRIADIRAAKDFILKTIQEAG